MKRLSLLLLVMLIPNLVFATNTELATPGTNIGIGTNSILNNISLTTGVAIGDATYTQATSPTQGAIIEGNVGIKTTSPTQALEVGGTVKSTSFIQTGSTINSFNGNTGVGNSSPTQALDVSGTVSSTSFIATGSVGIGTTELTTASLKILKNGSVDYVRINSSAAAGGNVLKIDNTGNIGVSTVAPLGIMDIEGTLAPFILFGQNPPATGISNNVGIGTSAVTQPFYVYVTQPAIAQANWTNTFIQDSGGTFPVANNAQATLRIGAGANSAAIITGTNTTAAGSPIIAKFNTTDGTVGKLGTNASSFTVGGFTGWGLELTANAQTKMTILSGGNVGIGTINPAQILEVNGTVNPFVVTSGGNVGVNSISPTQRMDIQGTIKATNFQSSDGSVGVTGPTCSSFKNGICVAT